MKNRNQKIIAALIVGALSLGGFTIPVVAKSTNSFNKTVSVVQGTKLDEARGLYFTMAFAAGELAEGTTYFIEAEDFEFDAKAYRSLDDQPIKITYQNKTRLKIEVPKTKSTKTIDIPVYGEVLKGKPKLIVDGEGSKATSGEYLIVPEEVTQKSALAVTAEEIPHIATDGTGPIADIQIIENVAGTLESGNRIKLSLSSNSNLKFRMPSTDREGYATSLEIEGLRGTASGEIKVRIDKSATDEKTLSLILEGITPSTSRGGIKIKGLEVMPEDRNEELAIGDVKMTFKMGELTKTELVVARVAKEGMNLKVKEEVTLVAGKESKRVEVTMSENVAGSLSRRHDVYFEVKGAKVVPGTLKLVGDSQATIKEDRNTKTDEVVGFTLDTRKIDPLNINKVAFSFEVEAEASKTGDVVLIADSNKFEERVKLGTVQSAVAIKMNPIQLKQALKDQVGGRIVLRETATGMFKSGDEIVIAVEKEGEGIAFTNATVEVEDVRIKETKFKDGKIVITIDRGSDEGAVITLKDIEMFVDGLVDQGSYDVIISGSGISDFKDDEIVLKDALQVGKKVQEEDTASNGLAKGIAQFRIGEAVYTMNGQEKVMDAAPYLSAANRVMVPVKYVSDAFGINGNKMQFSSENGGTITIEAGPRILQLVNGSHIAVVNGVQTPMDEEVAIVEGRTYVPVGQIARMLDIEVHWSNANKTATFANK